MIWTDANIEWALFGLLVIVISAFLCGSLIVIYALMCPAQPESDFDARKAYGSSTQLNLPFGWIPADEDDDFV